MTVRAAARMLTPAEATQLLDPKVWPGPNFGPKHRNTRYNRPGHSIMARRAKWLKILTIRH